MSENNNKCFKDLTDLEMKFSFVDDGFIGSAEDNKDFNVSMIEITCDSDEEWDAKIGKLKNELEKRRAK